MNKISSWHQKRQKTQIFPIFNVFMQFLSRFRQTPYIGMLKTFTKVAVCCPVVKDEIVLVFSLKKLQLDTETDKNPRIFQFSKIYAVFLKNFREIGMLERVNKEQMLSRMLSGTINAVFQMKTVWNWQWKRKNSKNFLFSSFFFQLLPNYR